MTQLTLFDTPQSPRKLARDTDPQTSHDAAKRTATALDRSRVLEVFREAWPLAMSAQEAAVKCAEKNGEAGDFTRTETYRKRAGELKQLEETGEKRNGQRLWVLREDER